LKHQLSLCERPLVNEQDAIAILASVRGLGSQLTSRNEKIKI